MFEKIKPVLDAVQIDNQAWKEEAACKGRNPHEVFKVNPNIAKEMIAKCCELCPVKEDCAVLGKKYRAKSGVWGGVFGRKEK
jgi:hypothetical protein